MSSNSCIAQSYHTDGVLDVPCTLIVCVGREVIYQATMKMKSLSVPPIFELVAATVRGDISDACMVRYQLNGHLCFIAG